MKKCIIINEIIFRSSKEHPKQKEDKRYLNIQAPKKSLTSYQQFLHRKGDLLELKQLGDLPSISSLS
jgi:hypothetical protein